MPSVRSVARALLGVLGLALAGFGVAIAVPAFGEEAFPAGLALGLGVLLFAAGGAALGGAALLSGRGLRPAQRGALKLAGVLAVLAFVLPAVGFFAVPDLLFEWFGPGGPAVAIVAWLYLTAAALLVAAVTVAWWGLEVAFEALAS